MSISGLSGASMLSAATSITPAAGVGQVSDKPQTAADKAKAKAAAAALAQTAMLADIRKKGIYAWAQEEKLAALKAKIRAQILTERHQTEETVAGMPQAERDTAESDIAEEITRRIKDAMQAAMEGQAKDSAAKGEPPKPMIIDISV